MCVAQRKNHIYLKIIAVFCLIARNIVEISSLGLYSLRKHVEIKCVPGVTALGRQGSHKRLLTGKAVAPVHMLNPFNSCL